jgi:hypothetical protein
VIPNGSGQATATPAGNRFARGTNVVLNALPEAGQMFLGWSGDTNGTQNPLTVTMNTNKVITANFTKRPQLALGPCLGGAGEDGFQFTLRGESGAAYQILGSTNLIEWAPLGVVTNPFGTVQFKDGAGTNAGQRFYRALAQ